MVLYNEKFFGSLSVAEYADSLFDWRTGRLIHLKMKMNWNLFHTITLHVNIMSFLINIYVYIYIYIIYIYIYIYIYTHTHITCFYIWSLLLALILQYGAITNSKELTKSGHLFLLCECWFSGVLDYKEGKTIGKK